MRRTQTSKRTKTISLLDQCTRGQEREITPYVWVALSESKRNEFKAFYFEVTSHLSAWRSEELGALAYQREWFSNLFDRFVRS
jgi:hypothetical protein